MHRLAGVSCTYFWNDKFVQDETFRDLLIFTIFADLTFIKPFIVIDFVCLQTKVIKEKSEGTAVLLDNSCSFDSHFDHCTSTLPKFPLLKISVHGIFCVSDVIIIKTGDKIAGWATQDYTPHCEYTYVHTIPRVSYS